MVFRAPERHRLEQKLRDYLRQNRVRRSDSRDAVFTVLLDAGDHLELTELLRRARERRVGAATVYRALRLFQQAGLVARIESASGDVSYEVSRRHHDHMICTRCGSVHEFHSPVIERIQMRLARKFGFIPQFHRHEIYGTCAVCIKSGGTH